MYALAHTATYACTQVVEALVGILDAHGIPKVCASGHSYGTFYASRLRQLHPERVQSMCLIDPVTFNMFTGGVCGCRVCAHHGREWGYHTEIGGRGRAQWLWQQAALVCGAVECIS